MFFTIQVNLLLFCNVCCKFRTKIRQLSGSNFFLLPIITYLNPTKNLSSINKIANFADYHKKGVFYVRKQTYFDQRSAG